MGTKDYIPSGSIGDDLGWKASKVERFCRAARVKYFSSAGKKGAEYRIDKDDFDMKMDAWLSKGPRKQSVTKMEEARLKRNRKARGRAQAKKTKAKKGTAA